VGKPNRPAATAQPPAAPAVVFHDCDLFDKTAAEKLRGNPALAQKLDDFQKFKAAYRTEPYGKSDKPFKSFGVFKGLLHAHLSGDVSIVYSIKGSNPSVISLYGLFSHDELGTGQPVNIKRQQNMDKRMASQVFKPATP
jgi:mRNA-degrading endonuclease YafQ of YafQ-DinJ toxin-antitoxin module